MPRTICLSLLVVFAIAGAARGDETPVRVERSPRLPPPGEALGTLAYPATPAEKQMTKGWKDEELQSGSPDTTTLEGKPGRRVSWFGIVRQVKEDKDQKRTKVLVEMKYFDGLTDFHQQIVSIFGAGDFHVVVPGTGHKIKPLSLVRVYGTVQKSAKDESPLVSADYVRTWDWGDFAFMDYGKDKSNPKWVAIRKGVDSIDVYESHPDEKYYKSLLGSR